MPNYIDLAQFGILVAVHSKMNIHQGGLNANLVRPMHCDQQHETSHVWVCDH